MTEAPSMALANRVRSVFRSIGVSFDSNAGFWYRLIRFARTSVRQAAKQAPSLSSRR